VLLSACGNTTVVRKFFVVSKFHITTLHNITLMNCIKEQRAVNLSLFFRHKVWLKTAVNFYQTTGSHVKEAINF